jgi:DNA-binding PadR family transcriptional regulator
MKLAKDLVAASAIPLLLSILEDKDSYGYAIIKEVKKISADEIQWTEGMLYPVLHRLEKQDLISSYWQSPEGGRKRRYYRITKAGKRELAALKKQWQVVNSTLHKSWNRENPPAIEQPGTE